LNAAIGMMDETSNRRVRLLGDIRNPESVRLIGGEAAVNPIWW
jgi:hypothetical protein